MFLDDLPDDPADAACELARRGAPIFPCDPASKKPLLNNGFHGATNKFSTVEGWFRKSVKYRGALIGLVTGQASGIVVLDIDTTQTHESDGFASLRRLEEAGFIIPPGCPRVQTAGGGLHYYFASPPGGLRSRNGIAPGIDLKADGGYVIAPPSIRFDGARWQLNHA